MYPVRCSFFDKILEVDFLRERVKRLVYRKSGISIWTYRNSKKSIHLMTSFTISEIDISISIYPFFQPKMDISIWTYRFIDIDMSISDISISICPFLVRKSIQTYRYVHFQLWIYRKFDMDISISDISIAIKWTYRSGYIENGHIDFSIAYLT